MFKMAQTCIILVYLIQSHLRPHYESLVARDKIKVNSQQERFLFKLPQIKRESVIDINGVSRFNFKLYEWNKNIFCDIYEKQYVGFILYKYIIMEL